MTKCSFDLLAIEVFSWTPHLETACEICLREAAAGRRVAFVFLDVENLDEFPKGPWLGPMMYRIMRKTRLAKVAVIERVLREHGVTVLPSPVMTHRFLSKDFTCEKLGLNSVEALRRYQYQGGELGIAILSSLIYHLGDTQPDLLDNVPLINRYLASSHATYRYTRQLVDQHQPDEVLLFNGRFACSKGIAEAARSAGARVLFHERGATHDRFYVSTRPPQSMANARERLREHWQAAGPERVQVAERFFSPGRGGAPLVEARYLIAQVRGQSVPDQGRRRVVYFSSSDDEHAAVVDGIEHTLFDSQRAAIDWLVQWVERHPDTELVIRVHPRMRQLSVRERAWWDKLSRDNVITIPAEDPVDSYALAGSADVVVCHRSSMGAEATYLGKPSILVGDALYRDLDCVYEPQSIEELMRLLDDRALSPKPQGHCLPFGYYRMMHGEKFRFYKASSFNAGSFYGEDVAKASQTGMSRLMDWLRRVRSVVGTR